MKIKGKQNIEYWITRGHNGEIIRVYQVDRIDLPVERLNDAFVIPIYVEWNGGMADSIADILEKMRYLKKANSELQKKYENEVEDHKKTIAKCKKRSWQFWK